MTLLVTKLARALALRWRACAALLGLCILLAFGVCLALRIRYCHTRELLGEALNNCGGVVWYRYRWDDGSEPGNHVSPREPPGPRWLRKILGEHFFAGDPVVIVYPEVFRLWEVDQLRVRDKEFDDVHLERLAWLPRLRCLRFADTAIRNDQLRYLGALKSLTTLDLGATEVADAGLASIAHLKELQTLDLTETHVTDVGLQHLRSLENLRTLLLAKTAVTGRGFRCLSKLQSLEWLDLSCTQVADDSGLAWIGRLRGLTCLDLSGSRVTGEGLAHLRRCPRLEELDLSSTFASLWGLRSLAQLVEYELSEFAREFLYGFPGTRLCKKCFGPEEPSYGGDGVAEGCLCFQVAWAVAKFGLPPLEMLMVDQADHAKQPQQAGAGAEHRLGGPATGRLEPQVGAHLLQGGLDRPATGVPVDHGGDGEARIGGVEVLVPARSGLVADEDPADGNQALPALVPMPGAVADFDCAFGSTVPIHDDLLQPGAVHDRARATPFSAFDTRPAMARVLRRSIVQGGVAVETGNQGSTSSVPVEETREFVGGVASVPQEDELLVGKPVQERSQQAAGQVDRRLVAAALLLVQFARTIQGNQHGQGPRSPCERKRNQDRQNHPLVSPTPDRVAVGAAHAVVVTPLPIDPLPLGLGHGIVAGDENPSSRSMFFRHGDDRRGEHLAQRPQQPRSPAEHAVVTRHVSGYPVAHRPEDRRHATPAAQQDRSNQQRHNAVERRLGKCYTKTHHQRLRHGRQRQHSRLLSGQRVNQHNQEGVFLREFGSQAKVNSPSKRHPKTGKSRA